MTEKDLLVDAIVVGIVKSVSVLFLSSAVLSFAFKVLTEETFMFNLPFARVLAVGVVLFCIKVSHDNVLLIDLTIKRLKMLRD